MDVDSACIFCLLGIRDFVSCHQMEEGFIIALSLFGSLPNTVSALWTLIGRGFVAERIYKWRYGWIFMRIVVSIIFCLVSFLNSKEVRAVFYFCICGFVINLICFANICLASKEIQNVTVLTEHELGGLIRSKQEEQSPDEELPSVLPDLSHGTSLERKRGEKIQKIGGFVSRPKYKESSSL